MEIHLQEDRIVKSTKGERRIKRRFRIEEDVRYKMRYVPLRIGGNSCSKRKCVSTEGAKAAPFWPQW